jgi:integrase
MSVKNCLLVRIQELMGHSSVTMTFDLYGHRLRDDESDREAAKKIEDSLLACRAQQFAPSGVIPQ